MPVPIGASVFAWCTLMAVVPIRHPRRLALLSWLSSAFPIELPFLFLYIAIASTVPLVVAGDLLSPGAWMSFGLSLAAIAGLLVIARRALRTGPVLDQALRDVLGAGWRTAVGPGVASGRPRHLPWARILLLPWPFRPRDVERAANIAYGDHGTSNLLDVYRHRSHPTNAPTLIYLHGGGFKWGKKNREARPLVHRLARAGWTCISANYHLSPTPAEGFPHHLIDVKKVIDWTRTHGSEHGVDPDTIVLAGSSAGAHLTVMAALTANDPRFQPGFEAADTSITAGIGLYGYYGELAGDADPPTTPHAYLRADAPPLFIVHGDLDTYTPVEGARLLVERLRATSTQPVVYAELPGGQHSFDMFHSIRFETVVDAVASFAASVRTQRADRTADHGMARR